MKPTKKNHIDLKKLLEIREQKAKLMQKKKNPFLKSRITRIAKN